MHRLKTQGLLLFYNGKRKHSICSFQGILSVTVFIIWQFDELIMEPTVPEGLNIIEWRMETKEEKQIHKSIHAAFEKPWNVEGLEHLSDMWISQR